MSVITDFINGAAGFLTGLDIQELFFLAGCALAAILFIIILAVIASRKKRARRYVRALSEYYRIHGNVREALKLSAGAFRKRSDAAAAVREAAYHCRHSILRDYRTAFCIVEETIRGKKVRELHKDILEEETAKKNSILLLTDGREK